MQAQTSLKQKCLLSEYEILIKKGFITDLVSSGRFLWFLIPPHGMTSNAAIVHDDCWRKSIFERKKCDEIFLSLLKESKVPIWQCYLMYLFVRTFGWMKNKSK